MECGTAFEAARLAMVVAVERDIVQNGLEIALLNTDVKREYNV
jgi:hypothetical protein